MASIGEAALIDTEASLASPPPETLESNSATQIETQIIDLDPPGEFDV